MRCPSCRSVQTKVIDSRVRERHDTVYRRRRCLKCRHAWATYEIDEESFQAVAGVLRLRESIRRVYLGPETEATTA